MCLHLLNRRKSKKTGIDNNFPKPVRYYGDLKQDLNDTIKIDSYYSPNCFRRPNHCKRICLNCTKNFYSYEKKNILFK